MPVFLTPLAGLVALAAVLPLAAALARERRLRRVRAGLGLAGPGRRAFASALAAAAATALLGLAAAQPALSRTRSVAERTDAQAYAVFDTTRSMLAVRGRGGPTRFARAVRLALRLRDALPQVPWGVAAFNQRLLVTSFPTDDRATFAAVVTQSIGVDRPPPAFKEKNATELSTISTLGSPGFYAPAARRRLAVVFTDGETEPVGMSSLRQSLQLGRVHVLVVRLWDPRDRVYDRSGRNLGYRPDPATAQMQALREAGVTVVPEREAGTLPARLRRLLGSGPTARPHVEARLVPLTSAVLLAAAVPLAFLVVPRRRRLAGTARNATQP